MTVTVFVEVTCNECGVSEMIEPSPRYNNYSGRNPFYSENSIEEDIDGTGTWKCLGGDEHLCEDCSLDNDEEEE